MESLSTGKLAPLYCHRKTDNQVAELSIPLKEHNLAQSWLPDVLRGRVPFS